MDLTDNDRSAREDSSPCHSLRSVLARSQGLRGSSGCSVAESASHLNCTKMIQQLSYDILLVMMLLVDGRLCENPKRYA